MKTRRWLGAVFLVVFGTLLALGGFAYTFTFPKLYEATTRIKVNEALRRRYEAWLTSQGGHFHASSWEGSELEVFQSKSFLYPVIRELALQRRWTEQRPSALTMDEAYFLLRGRLTISQGRGTALILITVRGHDAEEPALIANKIADVYRRLGAIGDAEFVKMFLSALKEKQATCDQELQRLAEESTNVPDLTLKRDRLQRQRAELQQLIDFETNESRRAQSSVWIVERAVPALRPVGPNVFLGTAVLMFGLGLDVVVLLWVMMGRNEAEGSLEFEH